MRKLGYRVIQLVQLIRFFGANEGLRIFLSLTMSGQSKTVRIRSRHFRNEVQVRKSQSDFDIFLQVFAELQYDIKFYLNFKPSVIVDCGSNVGYSILYFADLFPDAKIVGVEPDPRNFSVLQSNTASYPNVRLYQAGIWHTSARLDIRDSSDWSASLEVKESLEGSLMGLPLTQIMQENGIDEIGILKLDIEGAEKAIFEHDPHPWLSKTRCLIIELHDQVQPGTSTLFFREMARYDWITYVKGENIICFRS
ncbi:MAG: FkbM family methyltransferase [Ferruginibacter sp.]